MEATFHVGATGGAEKPAFIGILISESQSGDHACYVMWNYVANQPLLVADGGAGTAPATPKSLLNRQCEILLDTTGASGDVAGVTARFHIRFTPAFKGKKHIWGMAANAQLNGPSLKMLGDWTVE